MIPPCRHCNKSSATIQAVNTGAKPYYKLGHIMIETDQRSKAQELWNKIIQDYPDSPESTQAKEQLKKSGLS